MRIFREQTGMTAIATIAIIILVAFIAFLALKLIPVYLEYFSVVSSVNSLSDDPDIARKSKAEVLELLKRRFEINDVHRVPQDAIKFTRVENVTTILVKYEARVDIVGNIALIASFEKQAEFR
jgi:hypothetical protein